MNMKKRAFRKFVSLIPESLKGRLFATRRKTAEAAE
jgi:hypothetical protein